ncbi:MAG: hypothetical protein K2O31_04635 [Clostridia bacterium]|nr:hypothetical protein [Clostridia bacterium]MDE6605208.1 hypothetical protein [Clostridia bacterium]MDE7209149.1 hypothetical protein [Clostridia bacterium]
MLTKKQQEMDIKKWNDSQKAGYDTCGTYDFCSKCDKSLENPCDKAVKASKTSKPAAKKSATKKTVK